MNATEQIVREAASRALWDSPAATLQSAGHSDTPNHSEAREVRWSRCIDELLRVRRLEDDWDGQGSPAPEPALVDSAILFAKLYQERGEIPPDFTLGSVNGTIIFEWHLPSEFVEVEVVSVDRVEKRRVRRDSDVAEEIVWTRALRSRLVRSNPESKRHQSTDTVLAR